MKSLSFRQPAESTSGKVIYIISLLLLECEVKHFNQEVIFFYINFRIYLPVCMFLLRILPGIGPLTLTL